ncbi:MAG: glycosyltransferase family 1 protein, partial [Anaerolineae bacterium]|nr:glycosyltransferase family 1 protein [Anaerolineae bacterium]
LVDAGDVDAIGGALQRLVDDAALCRTLAERGQRRASEFTWEKAALALLETYEEAYGSKIDASSTT